MKVLSKWTLTPEEIAENAVFDRYRMHQKICHIFNESKIRFSIRNNKNNFEVLIISSKGVINQPLFGTILSKPFEVSTHMGATFRIECDLNAILQRSTLEHRNPIKIPLVGYEQIANWLKTRQKTLGGRIDNIYVGNTQLEYVSKKKYNIAWHSVNFDILVEDCESFCNMVLEGIGSSRHCGFGLVRAFRK